MVFHNVISGSSLGRSRAVRRRVGVDIPMGTLDSTLAWFFSACEMCRDGFNLTRIRTLESKIDFWCKLSNLISKSGLVLSDDSILVKGVPDPIFPKIWLNLQRESTSNCWISNCWNYGKPLKLVWIETSQVSWFGSQMVETSPTREVCNNDDLG